MPSSVIADYSYDAQAAILKVVFVSGMVYAYKNVPESVFLAMKKSVSKGVFLNRHIKGSYTYTRIK